MNIRDRFANLWNSEDVLDSLWRIFASPYMTMLLLACIAVLICLGILLPQRPAEALTDPRANSLWLRSLRERYHGIADWLLRLKLVDICRSLWLRGVLGLFAFNLILGAVDLTRPRHLLAKTLGTRTLTGVLSPSELPERLVDRVKQVLRGYHYRLVEGSNEGVVYADRFALFRLLVYLGVLLMIGGLALSERSAWWEENFVLRPSQVRPLGHGTALAIRAQVLDGKENLSSAQSQNGHTELTFFRTDREVGRTTLRDRTPSFYAGLLFWRTSTEPALLVKAQDGSGRNLALQTPERGATEFREVVLRFREDESPRYIVTLGLTPGSQLGRQFEQRGNERYVLVPSRDLTLRLLYTAPEPGEISPNFLVEAFRPNDTSLLYQHHLRVSNSIEIDGDCYTFEPQRYAVLKFGQDYGLALIGLGAALALAGVALTAWRPPQRMWLVTQTQNGEMNLHFTVSTLAKRTPQWFEDTVQSVASTLTLSAQSAPLHESGHAN